MSNTAYTKSSRASDGFPGKEQVAGEDYDEYDEYDDYGEYDEPEERIGLFSTPARTVSLVASFIVLLAVAVFIAWTLGQQAKSGTSSNGTYSSVNQGAVGSAPK